MEARLQGYGCLQGVGGASGATGSLKLRCGWFCLGEPERKEILSFYFSRLINDGSMRTSTEVLALDGDPQQAKRTSHDSPSAYGRRAQADQPPRPTPGIEHPAGVSAVNARS
jgi:hypothetical protein